MSSRSIPSVLPTWVVATDRRQELLIISEPTHWVSHWDVQLRRSRRCGGRECYLCSVGAQKQLRVVVMAIDSAGREKLLELRERHRELLDGIGSFVGARVSIKREGQAKNSPITVKYLEHSAAHERDISRLVESFGLEPILVMATEPTEFLISPSKESDSSAQRHEEHEEQLEHDVHDSTSGVKPQQFGKLLERLV